MLVLYASAYICSLVLIQNANIPYTYTKGSGNYGQLYSERYVTLYWFALMFSAFRLLTFLIVCMLLLFRNTVGCSMFWVLILVVFVAADFFVLAALASNYTKCNAQEQPNNPCNDNRYCCVNAIWMNPLNLCPNTGSCPIVVPSINALSANVDFVFLFSLTVAFCAFDLVFMFIPIGLWLAQPIMEPEDDIAVVKNTFTRSKAIATPLLKQQQQSAIDSVIKQTKQP